MGISTCCECLADLAFDPRQTRGRRHKRSQDMKALEQLDPFLLDVQALLNCKALRRLGSKTQVFTEPRHPHVRTRRIHTDEVVACSLIVAGLTGLNRDLCHAIALGHDIGHMPYGHLGEDVVSELAGKRISHECLGVVIAQHVERKGSGLNLCAETLMGILHHSSGSGDISIDASLPQECAVVMYADKIAYTFSDINDLLQRYELLADRPSEAQHLDSLARWFGENQRARTIRCINALVHESSDVHRITFEQSNEAKKFHELRRWLYANVYSTLVRPLHREAIRQAYKELDRVYTPKGIDPLLGIALLTDQEIETIVRSSLAGGIQVPDQIIERLGATEVLRQLEQPSPSLDDPDLGWALQAAE